MTPLKFSMLLMAAAMTTACSDSTEPTATVPRQLYYLSNAYSGQLYGAALDGSGPVPLLSDTLRDAYRVSSRFPPWISPDGRTITILAQTRAGAYVLLGLNRVGELQSIAPYGLGTDYSSSEAMLSPDGSRAAWFSAGYLNIAHPDGTGLTRSYFDSLAVFRGGPVAWSRGGKWLAYVMGLRDSFDPYIVRNEQIWILRLSDGFRRPVTSVGERRDRPAWSRDGKWLTFVSSTGINRVRTDGTGSEQSVYIGSTSYPNLQSWGPGDSLIAFTQGGSITVMRSDGSGARSLPDVDGVAAFGWGDMPEPALRAPPPPTAASAP